MKKTSPSPTPGSITPIAPAIAGIKPDQLHIMEGDALFRQGDKTFGIFFLSAGKIRMHRLTPDGGGVTVHIARAGEFFAEASLFADCYHCDADAETDCVVWLYPKDALTPQLREDSTSLWNFAAGLARGLHGLRLRYELKNIRSAPERVLQLLRLSCDDRGVYRTAGALKDMASELGLTHEALYRALAVLERKGRVKRAKDHISIL